MPDRTSSAFGFLRSTPVIIVTALLVGEIFAFNVLPTKEFVPHPPPLSEFTKTFGQWRTTQESPLDEYTQSLLRSDDALTREYTASGKVELFVAFFKSQRSGVTPHSPKVCLPGNGWTPETTRIMSIPVPGEAYSIPVNRYVVSQGELRKIVYYWYQNSHRVTADEYLSKFYLVYDSLRFRRSDEALVRVTADVGVKGENAADEEALQFIRDCYQPLKQQMWSTTHSAALLPPTR